MQFFKYTSLSFWVSAILFESLVVGVHSAGATPGDQETPVNVIFKSVQNAKGNTPDSTKTISLITTRQVTEKQAVDSDAFSEAAVGSSLMSTGVGPLHKTKAVDDPYDSAVGAALKQSEEILTDSKCKAKCAGWDAPWVQKCADPACSTCEHCLSAEACEVPSGISFAHPDGPCDNAASTVAFSRKCRTQCARGYTSDVDALVCGEGGAFSPATFTCTGQRCSIDVAKQHANGACEEGSKVDSESNCTTQCRNGFAPSVASLSCAGGVLTPSSFSCDPLPCAVPEVPHAAAGGVCASGSLASGTECTPSCAAGFWPTARSLECLEGALDPESFACEPAWPEVGIGRCLQAGRTKEKTLPTAYSCQQACSNSGGQCNYFNFNPRLEAGAKCTHFQNCVALSSTTGSGDDATGFTVYRKPEALDCAVPEASGSPQGEPSLHCNGEDLELGGSYTVPFGLTCSAQCAAGYRPSVTSLSCEAGGTLSPSSFTCEGGSCPVPRQVSNAHVDGPCEEQEDGRIAHGGVCTARCRPGFAPSMATLSCNAGTLSPTTFRCRAILCNAPEGIPHASASSCVEGDAVESGSDCTGTCLSGFFPSPKTLSCLQGELTPLNFTCQEAWPWVGTGWCLSPLTWSGDARAKSEYKCQQSCDGSADCNFFCYGENEPREDNCFKFQRCVGFKDEARRVDMSGYQCYSRPAVKPCVVPAPPPGHELSGPSLVCEEATLDLGSAGEIPFGVTCSTACASGYTPSNESLTCGMDGVLNPPIFSCLGNSCMAPRRIDRVSDSGACQEGNEIGHGSNCTPSCINGFTPSVDVLECVAGGLTPSTFTCTASPCAAPAGIVNAVAESACVEGAVVSSGSKCTIACSDGFWPNVPYLNCLRGQFSFNGDTPEVTCEVAWEKAGNGFCERPGVSTSTNGVTSEYGCQKRCDNKDDCNFFSYGDVQNERKCWLFQRCMGFDSVSPTGNDVSSYSCYRKAEALNCPVPRRFSLHPHAGDHLRCAGTRIELDSNAEIAYGVSCTTHCESGYTASVYSLNCLDHGVLKPSNFTCVPNGCMVKNVQMSFDNAPCANIEGRSIDHDGVCTTRCKGGYTPSVASLSCYAQTLTPTTFTCDPDPCSAPENISNASQDGTCSEGGRIDSGSVCTPLCARNFFPSTGVLDCVRGVLTPPTYTCEPAWEAVGQGFCTGFSTIESKYRGHPYSCQAECEESPTCNFFSFGQGQPNERPCILFRRCLGFSDTSPDGHDVSMYAVYKSPRVYPCTAPRKPDAPEASRPSLDCEGEPKDFTRNGSISEIPFGVSCTPLCASGYFATEEVLSCSYDASLMASTFTCVGNPCRSLDRIAKAHEDGACVEGAGGRNHGERCTAQCQPGFTPSDEYITCDAGSYTPSTFSCGPSPCEAPKDIPDMHNGGSCAEGSVIDSDSACTPACQAGYFPTRTRLGCSKGELSPPSFTCEASWSQDGAGWCTHPEWQSPRHRVDNEYDCQQACNASANCNFFCFGDVADAAPCTLFKRCLDRTEVSPEGNDATGYMCYKRPEVKPCLVPEGPGPGAPDDPSLECFGIVHKLGSDAEISFGQRCTTLCAPGYTPSAGVLTCHDHGVLQPATFECAGHPCKAPDVSFSHQDGACVEGKWAGHGTVCTTQCRQGFTPTVDTLSCTAGVFSPSDFVCEADGCPAPTNVSNTIARGACLEGSTISSDGACTPACRPGYIPTTPSLECYRGSLKPETFACVPTWEEVGTGWCKSPLKVREFDADHQQGCQAACESKDDCSFYCFDEDNTIEAKCMGFQRCLGFQTSGHEADVSGYKCYKMSSAKPCSLPVHDVEVVAERGNLFECDDGNTFAPNETHTVPFGAICKTSCGKGWQCSTDQMTCQNNGTLAPLDFTCTGKPCKSPDFIPETPVFGACREGQSILHDSNCTSFCRTGYTPTVNELSCFAGALVPHAFECLPSSCGNLDVNNSAEVPCKEGSPIPHRVHCTPACAEGYWPSQPYLSCLFGNFKPGNLRCEEHPVWQVEVVYCKNRCGDTDCKTRCESQWVPALLRTALADCENDCNFQHAKDANLRAHCSQLCSTRLQFQYEHDLLTYPEYRVNHTKCMSDLNFSLDEPASRRGLPGCVFIESRHERIHCNRDCFMAVPMDARTYYIECEDACKREASTVSPDEQDESLELCKGVCWQRVDQRIERERQAAELIGDISEGSVSSEAMETLAMRVVGVQETIKNVQVSIVNELQKALTGLMHAQWAAEEATRMRGGSGITKSRGYMSGSDVFHVGSYATPNMASIHNHPDNMWTAGIGEFAAVMNGVSFRTRHNDYSLRMPALNTEEYHKTVTVPFPPVPPSVLAQSSLEGQILELRTYFKAFKDDDLTLRDFRPYFKPILCYLEGGWEKLEGDALVEPFASERHHIAATGWKDLVEKIRFFDLSGNKDTLENVPYLPTAVMDISVVDGRLVPRLARWNYRILCHPVDGYVEKARLRLVQDSAIKALRGRSPRDYKEAYLSKVSRFRVDPRLPLDWVKAIPEAEIRGGRDYLDLLMEQIPGVNNYPADLRDEVLNPMTERLETWLPDDPAREMKGTSLNKQHVEGPLNTGYYSRYFVSGKDAMGRAIYKRGFNDNFLWAAMTTHTKVASASMTNSGSSIKPGEICMSDDGETPCPRVTQRWTYAFPLEIIYLSPMFRWNPYNISLKRSKDNVHGLGTEESPLTSATEKDFFHYTPTDFYGACSAESMEVVDSADTGRGNAWVLDQAGGKHRVGVSGLVTNTKCIPGVGRVRLRFPIMPLHEEGSSSWKEVKALEKLVQDRVVPEPEAEGEPESEAERGAGERMVEMTLGGGNHEHEVILDEQSLLKLEQGDDLWFVTSFNEGHTHELLLSAHENQNDESGHSMIFEFSTCKTAGLPGPLHECRDGHKALMITFWQD